MYIRQHGHEAATFEISDGPEQDFLGGLGFALCISLCLRLYSRAALQHLDGFMAVQILLFIAVICAGRISLVCAGVLQLGLDIEAAWQMQICTYLVSRHSFCAAHAYIDQGQHRPIPCIYRRGRKRPRRSGGETRLALMSPMSGLHARLADRGSIVRLLRTPGLW